jgi:alpha-galactosidase
MKIGIQYSANGNQITMVADQQEPGEFVVVDSKKIYDFKIEMKTLNEVSNEFGEGKQLKLTGKTEFLYKEHKINLEKVLTIELYEEFPNAAVIHTEYTNLSDNAVAIDKIVSLSYSLDRQLLDPLKKSYDFSLFQGRGVDWGLDYCNIKIDSNYSATNNMGITVAHRDPQGGGIPFLDVWGKEMGMAITHISKKPEYINMPLFVDDNGVVNYSIEEVHNRNYEKIQLSANEKYSTIKNALIVHSLDYFNPLRTYAEFLNLQGINTFKNTPDEFPKSYWKTWGYELDFKVSDIYSKIDEFKELGIEMIVLDDGWFSNYGDWEPSTDAAKFPDGRKSLRKFVDDFHKQGFKVGIWWCPLIAEPHTQVAKENPEWFMVQENGSPYLMKGPDSYFLCPDYGPVLKFWEEQIEKLYIEFDLDFVYHDWANLIEVPPCYNPLHKHESVLSPYWNMSRQYKVMYDKIQSIKPGSPVEMCECGRPHDPYKMPFYNMTNASDATSKEQVRQKLKVEKALNGSKVFFNPGYVLPVKKENWDYDPCEIDECVAMGGYFETYYTDIPPEVKTEWIDWLKVYYAKQIYTGEYLNLYDIEFDKPETHVTKKDETFYFYCQGPYSGNIELRGLENKNYNVFDLLTNELLGNVNGSVGNFNTSSTKNIYLEVKSAK